MSEPAVVLSLKKHLMRSGLNLGRVERIIVDAHASNLTFNKAAQLEPMACIHIGQARPDLICRLSRPHGTVLAGFEVKPTASTGNWVKGLGQARRYRNGVHFAYLALPEPVRSRTELERQAHADGVGLIYQTPSGWIEAQPPADLHPRPELTSQIALALEGIPVARRLQLNHPLNYLVVPFLRQEHSDLSIDDSMARFWPSLGSPQTRRHAINGSRYLGLLDDTDQLTVEGAIAAALMKTLSFNVEILINRKKRFSEITPTLALVGRSTFLRQPSVRLIIRILQKYGPLNADELVRHTMTEDPVLASALFLQHPTSTLPIQLEGAHCNPSTFHKLKQNLWHVGLLKSGKHATAGRSAQSFRPHEDRWEFDDTSLVF